MDMHIQSCRHCLHPQTFPSLSVHPNRLLAAQKCIIDKCVKNITSGRNFLPISLRHITTRSLEKHYGYTWKEYGHWFSLLTTWFQHFSCHRDGHMIHPREKFQLQRTEQKGGCSLTHSLWQFVSLINNLVSALLMLTKM